MRLFRRRPPAPYDPLALLADELAGAEARARLLRIVAEALILQDRAEELLAAVRDREPLGEVAPRGGPLASRFFALRRDLPPATDVELGRQVETVRAVLDHHGWMVVAALDMLAADWRSEAAGDQLERLEGLGPPAERLDALYAELVA